MGVENTLPEEDGSEVPDDVTIGELKDIYGESVVNRALGYMFSLPRAQRNFLKSVEESEEFADQYTGWVSDEEVDEDAKERLRSSWVDGMVEGGLGLDDE